ncbi:ATP-NADH kinase YEF1 [Wickerhamiella sorbophila]|uniref:ATP-NADH kinase YEF1 n=1 Tax=Wickerhamiella sorbophila TaxID=45607 RepID=A0A2T0FG36_9ASCO|nr:ATP-NADH kinase YEF1 [Wickerhamiella sorbophila]PRT53927.1 ATP-NADH kinase YEF1 [Wickerhamiella sorbophila]
MPASDKATPNSSVMIHNMLASAECCAELNVVPQANQEKHPAGNSSPPSGLSTPKKELVWVDSKERLSEMATSIRGISNALSNINISLKVKAVAIITKLSDRELRPKLRQLVEYLLTTAAHPRDAATVVVYVQDFFKDIKEFGYEDIIAKTPQAQSHLKFWTPDLLQKQADMIDLVITLGGDGTVLYTSWIFQSIVPPVLSFGLGSLGFMTENVFENFKEVIDERIQSGISCALRMRFHCMIWRSIDKAAGEHSMYALRKAIESSAELKEFPGYELEEEHVILNDVVIDRGPNPTVGVTELYGNHEFLTSIQADGVVISTPTGSTAYSMSAGGSLVHPDVPAILVTPVCPHSLSFRPLVLPDSMLLHLGVPYDARSSSYVSFDGKERVELGLGDCLTITASSFPFPKVMAPNASTAAWVQRLGNSLHWNELRRAKAFT